MNILVIGCDQVGAALVRDLERIGHDISLIEKDPEQLKRLDSFDDYSFGGTALVGDPTAGALSQDLRAGHNLPHHPDRTGRVPCAGEVRSKTSPAIRSIDGEVLSQNSFT